MQDYAEKKLSNKDSILCLDYGEKTLGLALSDSKGIAPAPIGTMLLHSKKGFPYAHLKKLINQHGVGLLLIGYPACNNNSYNKVPSSKSNQSDSTQAGPPQIETPHVNMRKKVKLLRARLKKYFPKQSIQLFDETLSSWSAKQRYFQRYHKKLNKKNQEKSRSLVDIDSLAALEILEAYLQKQVQKQNQATG